MTISAYSTTAGSNSAINGVNIAEGCAPGNINDAIRNQMADIANGPIVTAAGSVGAPAYSFSSDLDTGIYRVSADVLGIATAGVVRATFGATGTVAVASGLTVGVNVEAQNFVVPAVGGAFSASGTNPATILLYGATGSPANSILLFTANAERMRIGSGGQVGIGGTASGKLQVVTSGTAGGGATWDAGSVVIGASGATGSAVFLAYDTTANLGKIGALSPGSTYRPMTYDATTHTFTNAGSTTMSIDTSGNVVAAGNITANSDRRLKTDIEPLTGSLDAVLAMQGVRYTRISDGSRQIGLIAQDVEEVRREYVHTDGDGLKSLAYPNIVADLIEAVKTLSARIVALGAAR